MSAPVSHPIPPKRRARIGEMVLPLSGGRYHRDTVGALQRVGGIDPEKGVLFAKTRSGGTHGWQVDPKPLGRRTTKPYLDLDAPYIAGVTSADLDGINAAVVLKKERMAKLEDAYRRSIAEIEARFYNSAQKIQAAIDQRGEQQATSVS